MAIALPNRWLADPARRTTSGGISGRLSRTVVGWDTTGLPPIKTSPVAITTEPEEHIRPFGGLGVDRLGSGWWSARGQASAICGRTVGFLDGEYRRSAGRPGLVSG